MMLPRCFAFVDGGYTRRLSEDANVHYVDPRFLAVLALQVANFPDRSLIRTIYYDARPDDEPAPELLAYWRAVEELPDTDLGWGTLRGGERKKLPRQKGVDTLMAVDMLSNAFARNYDLGVLVAGDADFVPVVHEVRRHGIRIVVAAEPRSVSADLRHAADRVVEVGPTTEHKWFPFLQADGQYFGPLVPSPNRRIPPTGSGG